MPRHLVGVAEIAEMLGVSRPRVSQLVEAYGDFPAPEAELASGRIWSRTAVETWIRSHPTRPTGRPERRGAVEVTFVEQLSEQARGAITLAQEEARLFGHNYIGCEHLLLGLLRQEGGQGGAALRALGVTAERARGAIEQLVGHGGHSPQGHLAFTPRAKRSLDLACRQAGEELVRTEHILGGLLEEGDENVAVRVVLGSVGGTRASLRGTIDELLIKQPHAADAPVEDDVVAHLRLIEGRLSEIERRLKP